MLGPRTVRSRHQTVCVHRIHQHGAGALVHVAHAAARASSAGRRSAVATQRTPPPRPGAGAGAAQLVLGVRSLAAKPLAWRLRGHRRGAGAHRGEAGVAAVRLLLLGGCRATRHATPQRNARMNTHGTAWRTHAACPTQDALARIASPPWQVAQAGAAAG